VVKTGTKLYSRELDFLKVIAIIMVVAFHYFGQLSGWHMQVVQSQWFFDYLKDFTWLKLLHFVEAYFYLGVNLFVITSGFGLYLSFLNSGKPLDLKEFFRKRVFRLMPPAVLTLIVIFFVKGFLLHDWPVNDWYVNIFPFLGGLNLFADVWFYPPINGETWFLGLIVQLYLFFPLLVYLLHKMGSEKFLIMLFLVSVVFRIIYYFTLSSTVSSLSYGLSIGRLFEFGFGMMAAQLYAGRKKLSMLWVLGLLLFAGYFFPWSFPFTDSLLGIGLFVALFRLVSGLGQLKLTSLVATKISGQSYLIFLLQHPFIWVLNGMGLTDTWTIAGVLVFVPFIAFVYFLAKACQWLISIEFKPKRSGMSV